MKKVIAVAAGLLLTTSAFASTVSYDNSTNIVAGVYETKAQAFDAGFDLSDSLQAMSQYKLAKELPLYAYNSVKNLSIEGAKVIVEEVASSEGNIQYRAIVDVDYHFSAHESN